VKPNALQLENEGVKFSVEEASVSEALSETAQLTSPPSVTKAQPV
jgi:hypothetical protein